LVVVVGCAHASCFGKDVGFKPANAKPTVTQPSRSDPNKVMVDWSKILKNPQCADSFTVLMWADGTQKTSATKFQVDKNTKSKIVDIQPCVGYRFAVEAHEKNTIGTKKETSGDQLFKTAGASSNIRLDASRFHVTYHWDAVKKVVDLKMATISIPRDQLPGASCLDYIQITGEQVRPRKASGSRSPSRSRSFNWGHLGQAGGAVTLPASLSSGQSYSSAVRGGSGARGPAASSWSSSPSANTRSRTSSTGSRSPSLSGSRTPSSPGSPAVSRPDYANSLPRPKGGSTSKVGPIRVQPPFLNPIIEMNVPVKDCMEYNFEIKLYAPRGKEIAKVSNIKLPALADVPGYVPPPLTSVMSITYGSSGKPIYGVKTSSGVTAACLPAYYEAYDAYTHRLENEVGWQNKEGNRAQSLVTASQNQLGKSQEELLRKAGCVCTSPHLDFATTDASFMKKHAEFFGHFSFQGMHASKPYYVNNHATTSSGGSRPSISTTTRRPSTPAKPIYLFWEEKKKQWMFGPTLGNKSGVDFGSVENSLAKCPGDPPATGNWQYKTSVLGRWKKSAALKLECQIRH